MEAKRGRKTVLEVKGGAAHCSPIEGVNVDETWRQQGRDCKIWTNEAKVMVTGREEQ